MAVPRAKKKVDAPPPLVAHTPQQAMAQSPRDLDSIAVYADSIARTEPELSEYINVGVQIEREATPELLARKDELWRAHGEQWLSNWNSPIELFAPRFHGIAGLPASVRIDEELPDDLAAFEEQVAQFPIATLSTYKVNQRGLVSLTPLALLRRIDTLIISSTTKVKLGKPTLAWLHGLQLAHLRSISLSGVDVTPEGIRAVLDSLPALRELRMFDCFVTVECIDAIAESRVAANLEKLDLAHNRIGSAAIRTIASFPELRELDLRRNDIGDDICETEPPQLPITALAVDDNKRLGAKGLAWLVAAMPELRRITLGRDMKAPTIRALAPIAAQLEVVHGSWLPLDAKSALIGMVGPNLTELTFSGDCQRLDLAKLTSLRRLELGDITEADVRALTTLPFDKLEYLELCSPITDRHAQQFLEASNLPALRTLYIRSRVLTTAGIGALLEMPQLAELQIMYAKLAGASRLKPRAHPFRFELVHHNLSPREAARLSAVWGERLLLL